VSGKKYREKEGFFFSVFFIFTMKSMGWRYGLHVACNIERQEFFLMIRCDRRSPMASIFGADSGGAGC
jgi:hypothetical protein